MASFPRPTVGSLFSGIGGFDLGFERAGFDIRWQVEIDPFCRAVLRRHWPDVKQYDDVTTFGLRGWRGVEPVDVLIAGFPCQDVSDAGKREGLTGHRSWLWWHVRRAARLLRPRILVVENVRGLLVRGLGTVCGSLARIGYDAEWTVVRASDVGAPHRRARVFLLAHPKRHAGGEYQQWERRREAEHGQIVGASSLRRLADPARGGQRVSWQAAARDHGQWVDSSGATVADTERAQRGPDDERDESASEWQQAASGAGSIRPGATGLADPDDHGREQRSSAYDDHGRDEFRHEPDGRRASGVANATSAGREGLRSPVETWGRQPAALRADRRTHARPQWLGDVESPLYQRGADAERWRRNERVGRGSESGGIAFADWRGWPSHPGEPQAEWEPPRVLSRAQSGVGFDADGISPGLVRHRRRALAALGNSIVPQVAEVVAWRVRRVLATVGVD